MSDDRVALGLRIEAAKALLPCFGEARPRDLGSPISSPAASCVLRTSVDDALLTLPLLSPGQLLASDDPQREDVLPMEERERAGFGVNLIVHTSDLGEAWGNVLVVIAITR